MIDDNELNLLSKTIHESVKEFLPDVGYYLMISGKNGTASISTFDFSDKINVNNILEFVKGDVRYRNISSVK